MRRWVILVCLSLTTFVTSLLTVSGQEKTPPDPQALQFFEKKIRPVLVEHCYSCHSVEAQAKKKLKGGLLLDSGMRALGRARSLQWGYSEE